MEHPANHHVLQLHVLAHNDGSYAKKTDALETFMNGDAINAKSRFLAAGTKNNWVKMNSRVVFTSYIGRFLRKKLQIQ